MALTSGNGQTDTVLGTLPSPYRVTLKNETGAVVAGVTVTWAATVGSVNGSGTTTTMSDAAGDDTLSRTLCRGGGGPNPPTPPPRPARPPAEVTPPRPPGFPPP